MVTLLRRFGGHGGIATEWEITTDWQDLHEIIRKLPEYDGISHSMPEHVDYHAGWINLPQGTPADMAGMVAAQLAAGDVDGLAVRLKIVSESYTRRKDNA